MGPWGGIQVIRLTVGKPVGRLNVLERKAPYNRQDQACDGTRSVRARSHSMSAYQELHQAAPGREQARGQQFNDFLAELLRRGGLDDVHSNQRGLHGRDEIDVTFMLGPTPYILEAKWETAKVDIGPIAKLSHRLKSRPPGVRGVVVSMSGYTKHVYGDAESFADILLLERPHIESLVSGLFTAPRLFQELLSVTSRRGGSCAPLADLLPTPAANNDPLPPLRPVQEPHEAFPAIPEPGVTVTELVTTDGPWTAGEVAGLTVAPSGHLLWTTFDGVLRVDPDTGATAWTTAPALCHGPVLAHADGATTVLAEGAALRFRGDDVEIVGGGFAGSRCLLPGPEDEAWVFSSTGPRTAGGYGGHTLTRLGDSLHDSTTYEVAFAGKVHQAALTPTGTLYLAGGGYSVTTDLTQGLRCPRDRWADSAPLTPTASLAIGDHTVLLAGRTGRPGHGVEKALYAVDTRDHTPTLLFRLPNTTGVTGLARDRDGAVYLLTDIRGNEQAPRPHLLIVTLPAGLR